MIGHLVDLTLSRNGRQRVTVELSGDFAESFDSLREKLVDVTIKQYRDRRSLDANAYFHALVNQIARKLGETDPEPPTDEDIKRRLVMDYGVMDRLPDGGIAGFILPASADPAVYHKYAKEYKRIDIGGRENICYICYKPTHEMDSKEMAQLIDGTVKEAAQLGIPTDPQEYIDKIIAKMEAK